MRACALLRILAAALVAGCAVPVTFDLIDQRPEKEKRDFDPGERFAFVTAGDQQFVPDRLTVMRERMAAKAGDRVSGKQVYVTQLITWYVRTPASNIEPAPGMALMPPEEVFGIKDIRKFRYWVICDVAVRIGDRNLRARGTEGFDGPKPDFSAHHRDALMRAIDQIINGL